MTKQVDLQELRPSSAHGCVSIARTAACRSRRWRTALSRQQLGRYEKGEDLPQTATLIRLSLFMERSVQWILFGEDAEERVPSDPMVRECMFDLEAASPHYRRSVVQMAYALMTADRAEEKLLSRQTGERPPEGVRG